MQIYRVSRKVDFVRRKWVYYSLKMTSVLNFEGFELLSKIELNK